jgi:hypothetical protein
VSQFRSKFPGYVDDAVREAVAANKRPKDILAGLRAGTLPGLEGRTVQIADRTFYRRLADARAKLRAEPIKQAVGGSVLIARLLAGNGATPEEIRSRLEARGTDPEVIDAAVEELRQDKLAEQRDRDERERIRALASEGLRVEQIREATGFSWRELKNRLTELLFGRLDDRLTKDERVALGDLSSWITADKLRGQPEPVRAPGDYGPPTRK